MKMFLSNPDLCIVKVNIWTVKCEYSITNLNDSHIGREVSGWENYSIYSQRQKQFDGDYNAPRGLFFYDKEGLCLVQYSL